MAAIRIETVNDLIRHRHEMYGWCPGCQRSREIELDRLVRLGRGEKCYRELRIRCRTCKRQVQLFMRGPAPKLQRPRPDNIVMLR